MNLKFCQLLSLVVSIICFIIFTSCSKDKKAKILDRDVSSSPQTPSEVASDSLLETPVIFRDLFDMTNNLKTTANVFVSGYYPNTNVQSPRAARFREGFDALPPLIAQAITSLCTNTADSNTLDFHGIPVSKTKVSTLISDLEQTSTAFSNAQVALDDFYTYDLLKIDRTSILEVQTYLNELQSTISALIQELKNLDAGF